MPENVCSLANGRLILLAPGLELDPPRWLDVEGSMSREERKEVLSSSSLWLVMVTKRSSKWSASDFEVPFKSRIWKVWETRQRCWRRELDIELEPFGSWRMNHLQQVAYS